MNTNSSLHTRECRTVERERLPQLTTFERQHGARQARPARRNARLAAIAASAVGVF